MKQAFWIFCALLVTININIAQQRDDIIRPFWGIYDSQSLTTAIGNATVASGQLVPGLTSNPANLGLHRISSFSTSFMNGTFNGDGVEQSNTRFGGLYGISPVQVYQGSLVFGYGVQRELDFSQIAVDGDVQFKEEGGMYRYQLGFAVEMVENFFTGAELSYYRGSDETTIIDPEITSHLNPDYGGFGISVGFIQRINSNLLIGGSVELPKYIWVGEAYSEWKTDTTEVITAQTYNYLLQGPLTFRIGASYINRYVNLFYELEWADYKTIKFSSDEYFDSDVVEINNDIESVFRSTVKHHFGIAGHLPWIPLHLYSGYQYLPVSFEDVYDENRRQSYSFGFSYMLNHSFSLHGSFAHYFWKYRGQDESFNQLVFGASLHY